MHEGHNTPNLTKNTEYKSHLTEGAQPIIACLISRGDKDFGEDMIALHEDFDDYSSLKTVHNIDWNSGTFNLDRQKFLHAGSTTYVMSTIDSFQKFSRDFIRCTGLVVAGVEKETGRKISFLTHQDPARFLSDLKYKFTADLEKRLEEMKKRCIPGTIDAVIVGGRYIHDGGDESDAVVVEDYPASLEFLGQEVKKVLGFEPVVINGPKTVPEKVDSVYYNTENNRLYLIRPKVANAKNFVPSDTNKHQNEWK